MSFTPDQLHVILVVSNPVRYKSRYELFKKTYEHMKESGVTVWVCEAAFGDRNFECTEKGNPQHLQLRSPVEIWQKEALINAMMRRIFQDRPDAKYICWADADIQFVSRKDWACEIIHSLQHYQVVQCWSHCVDLGPSGEVIQMHESFMYSYLLGRPMTKQKYYGKHWHPGYVWAAKAGALKEMAGNGLMDRCVLGSADAVMARALIGQVEYAIPDSRVHKNYKKMFFQWQEMAEHFIKRNVGYVPLSIVHGWHGKKKQRYYVERSQILVDYKFDPETDVKYDNYGLLKLSDFGTARSNGLRDALRQYFRARNEDSIDVL